MTSTLSRALVVDRAVSPRVRVRSWSHADATPVRGRPAAHDGFEIAWITKGAARYRVGRHEWIADAGSVALVPDGVEHETTFLTDVRAGAVWLAREFVDELADACGLNVARLAAGAVADAPRVSVVGRELEEELRWGGAGQVTAALALVETLCLRAMRTSAERRSASDVVARPSRVRDRRVRAAIELIESRYGDTLDVDAMARAAGMSRFHFSRAFRDATGKAPYGYLLDVRVRRAAELLRGGRYNVTEVAFAVGFHDLGRFARAFRQTFGATPAAWLRNATA